MIKNMFALALVVAALGVTATEARASIVWSTVPQGCTPIGTSGSLMDAATSWVTFATGKTGKITLICPVDLSRAPNIASMTVTYQDSDGTSLNGYVEVGLFYTNRATGAGGLISAFYLNSSSYSDTGVAEKTVVPGPTALDYFNNAYYIMINISRNSTSLTEGAMAVTFNY